MLSLGLWNKASEFGSKLKESFQYQTDDRPLVEKDLYDKLKEEYDKLKIDFEEKSKKYDNMIKDINNKKEKEANNTESQFEEYYNEITDKFKNYLLNLFDNDPAISEEINLIFINPHDENFDSKVNAFSKNKLQNIIVKNIFNENKILFQKLLTINTNSNENNKNNEEEENKITENETNIKELEEINTKEDLNNLFNKINETKLTLETLLNDYIAKSIANEQKFQTFQENIEKMQKDCREAKNSEDSFQEKITNLKNDLSEKISEINGLKKIIEQKNNDIGEKDINNNSYKTTIEQLNLKNKELYENNEIITNKIAHYEEENKSLNLKLKNLKSDLELLQTNSDEINNKNIQITELMQNVESLKASYKILEDSKIEFEKEKNEEIEVYKNKILELTQNLSNLENNQKNEQKNEEIEKIYLQKISELEKQNNYEKEFLEIKKRNEDLKNENLEMKKKMVKELRDNEFMIDKRVISSVLVSYFDVNSSDLTKKNLLETLSSIMEYSNEDREKMGLKPIHIGDKKQGSNNDNKLKSISEGLYDFICNGE